MASFFLNKDVKLHNQKTFMSHDELKIYILNVTPLNNH